MTVVLVVFAVWFAVWIAVWLIARAFQYRPRPQVPIRPSVQRKIRANVPHVLYHYLHALRPGRRYIGISNEPTARHRFHSTNPRGQWWFQTSTQVMEIVARYPNLQAARIAERAAIADAVRNGEDIANTQHVPRWYRQQLAAQARRGVRR